MKRAFYLKYTHFRVYRDNIYRLKFTTVFHRILDFKTGLDFYPGPFFCSILNECQNLTYTTKMV